jgi:predicted permease
MPYENILEIMLPIVIMIAAGYVFAKIRRIDLKPVVDIVMFLTVPCLIMSSILKAPLPLKEFITVPAASAFVVLGGGLMTLIISKVLRIKATPGMYMGSMFMNSGIIAFPIILSAYGLNALSKAIIFDATNGLLIFTLGIFILVGSKNAVQIFKLPVIYSIIAAALLNPISFQIPEIVINTLSTVGSATIPLMLLILGYRMNSVRGKVFGPSLLASIIRLAGGLALAIAFVKLFGIAGTTRSVILISSSMPTAMNSLLLSEEYGVDSELAAGTVMMTTMLSFLALPLVMHFIV